MFTLNRVTLIGRIRGLKWDANVAEFTIPMKVFRSAFRDANVSFQDAKTTWILVRSTWSSDYLKRTLQDGLECCVEGELELALIPFGTEGRTSKTVCITANKITPMSNEVSQPAERVAETVVEPEDTYGTDLQDFGEDLAW